ncbi:MAG: DNA repair protein RadA [Candidatus Caenarcaniphilales bacterium]|nr:DNA repair protein RadA [Candidatus Caenarcaniphilales bacterium]
MSTKSKKSVAWFCKECGYESLTYLGRCPACSAWSSFIEQPKALSSKKEKLSVSPFSINSTDGQAVKLSEINSEISSARISTGFKEFDNVLGKGLQRGSLILMAGDPGIGKSTLLLQVMGSLASRGLKVLYVSGEESKEQVKGRSQRLNVSQELMFMAETDLEVILGEIERVEPEILVVDSIQAVHLDNKDSFPGSQSQIRDCANLLMQLAKKRNITTIVVGHITKEGNIAGPKLLEHMVDVVLYFEGDKQNHFRIIKGAKNRFGPTDEVGLFEMQEGGLSEVTNASSLFLSPDDPAHDKTGTLVTATLQGNRVILAEIQSLVGYTAYPQPKRMVNGLDYNRANQVVAILERRIGLSLAKQDVYSNVVGGLEIVEPAADLAICLSIISCARDLKFIPKLIAIGELGLAGEVRPVSKIELRLKEAQRQGFKTVIMPNMSKGKKQALAAPEGLKLIEINHISEALIFAFSKT